MKPSYSYHPGVDYIHRAACPLESNFVLITAIFESRKRHTFYLSVLTFNIVVHSLVPVCAHVSAAVNGWSLNRISCI